MTDFLDHHRPILRDALLLLRAKITRLHSHNTFMLARKGKASRYDLDEPWERESDYSIEDVDGAIDALASHSASATADSGVSSRRNLDDRLESLRSHLESEVRSGMLPDGRDVHASTFYLNQSRGSLSSHASSSYNSIVSMSQPSWMKDSPVFRARATLSDQLTSPPKPNPFDPSYARPYRLMEPESEAWLNQRMNIRPSLRSVLFKPPTYRLGQDRRKQVSPKAATTEVAILKARYKAARLEARARLQQRGQQSPNLAARTLQARVEECIVCTEPVDVNVMYRSPCDHHYCQSCVTQAVEHAVASRRVARCCRTRLESSLLAQYIDAELFARYTNLVQELDTPNPMYCSRPECSTFIPPARIRADRAECPTCWTDSCALCRAATHPGVCRADTSGTALKVLAGQNGWKACPGCHMFVERIEGCLHMTCHCGYEFCYNCVRPFRVCQSTCARS